MTRDGAQKIRVVAEASATLFLLLAGCGLLVAFVLPDVAAGGQAQLGLHAGLVFLGFAAAGNVRLIWIIARFKVSSAAEEDKVIR